MSTTTEITVLVDNKADKGLMAEHGLALWIETTSSRVLFDTGQGKALPHNAEMLGINLGEADSLVLSHGHYDHSGGVSSVVGRIPGIQIYCHPAAVVPRYSIRSTGQPKAIHMPQGAKIALNNASSDHLHWVSQPLLLAPDIGITGPIPRKIGYEDTGGPFFLDSEGHYADPIDDDQALWIKTPRGLIIIVGCSHAGVINTIDTIQKISGEKTVIALIGGFHLKEASEERLSKTASFLQELNAESIVPCHCTGEQAIELFHALLGDRVKPGHAGLKIRV